MLQLLSPAFYRLALEVVPTKPSVRMHRALIVWPDGVERDSHVKMACPPDGMPDRQLLNEGVAWLLAYACNLPVPPHAGYMILPPALVTAVHPNATCAAAGALAWICSTEPKRALRLSHDDDPSLLTQELIRWTHLPGTLALDEWLANEDRHGRNLIRRGPDDFVLIDHDHAFTGPHWLADLLFESREDAFTNRLYDIVEEAIGRSSASIGDLKNAMVPPAEAFERQLSDHADHLSEWLALLLTAGGHQWSLAAFIAYRAVNTPDVIKRRYQLLT